MAGPPVGRPPPAVGRDSRADYACRGSVRCVRGRGFDSRRLHHEPPRPGETRRTEGQSGACGSPGLSAVESVANAPVDRPGVVRCPDDRLGSVAGDLDVDLVAGEAAVTPSEA